MELIQSDLGIRIRAGAASFYVQQEFASKLIWILDSLGIVWEGELVDTPTLEIDSQSHQEVEAKVLEVDYDSLLPKLIEVGATPDPIIKQLTAQWMHRDGDNQSHKVRIREERNITGATIVMIEVKQKVDSITDAGIKHCIEIGVETTSNFNQVLGVFESVGFESRELPSKKIRRTHTWRSKEGDTITYDFDTYLVIDGKGPFPTLLEVEAETYPFVQQGLFQIGVDSSRCVDLSPLQLVEHYYPTSY